jgi:beta-glucosidase
VRRLSLLVCLAGCAEPPPPDLAFPPMGSLSAASGKGAFRFGAASAATQIEDQNPHTDWYLYTRPKPDGLGVGTFVGDAAKGYTKAIEDIQLIKNLKLDSYRFSVEWARVEPVRDQIDEAALEHYSKFIDALIAAGIKPVITVHHFSNPVWVDDPRDKECTSGPSSTNLCGLGHPTGGPMVVQEMAQHARLLAERFGDRVTEWGTLNEPVNYLLAAFGIGQFPPGKVYVMFLKDKFVPVFRDYLSAHAAMYKAIKAARPNASVGLSLSVAEFVPSRDNEVSQDPADIAARDRLIYIYHHLVVEALRQGKFDPNVDQILDEPQPEWKGTLDWLGVQYYFRSGVSGQNGVIPVVDATPCFGSFDFGSCIAPTHPTYCVPAMHYEFYSPGLYNVLKDFGKRWPDLPLLVSESGLATRVGPRRAENVVRQLEAIEQARAEGVDVRGYYHWSLYDNFEWAEGFGPRFGLYTVDYNTYSRTATEGATVLGEIAGARTLSSATRSKYGGNGPMTPEPGVPDNAAFCTKAALGF